MGHPWSMKPYLDQQRPYTTRVNICPIIIIFSLWKLNHLHKSKVICSLFPLFIFPSIYLICIWPTLHTYPNQLLLLCTWDLFKILRWRNTISRNSSKTIQILFLYFLSKTLEILHKCHFIEKLIFFPASEIPTIKWSWTVNIHSKCKINSAFYR